MENLSMCRICLATDVRLCSIASHLRDMYERISSMTFKRECGRPQEACYICHARLNNCYQLRTSCLQSEELLTEMMSSGEFKTQDVLSTNTFRVVSVLHFSLSHAVQDSPECHVKEETPEIIHDVELDQNSSEDIKIESQEEYDSQLDGPLDIINGETDDVVTDDEDIKLEIEDTILEETERIVDGLCSQLPDNICPKIVKMALQRMDVNDITTGTRVSKNNKIASLKDTEDATTNKRKKDVKKNEETEDITIKKPKIVPQEIRVDKPVTTSEILETSKKIDIKLNKCENVVTTIVNSVREAKSTNNTSLEHNVSCISISKNNHFVCDICKKFLGCKTNLKIHIRTHTGEKPYGCNACTKWFNTKSDLKRHIRTHTGEKPYVCNICKKCFTIQSNLKRHIRTHTN